ncbi:MAG: sigma-70 family RNA polymerase sigma factor [Rubrivivax sp.]
MSVATATAPRFAPPMHAPTAAPTWGELTAHRADLVRFARRRLLDPALAEDLVHDVFEAVISGRAAFGGRSMLKSWLVGILKHKIVDLVRERVGHHRLPEDGELGHAELVCPRAEPDEVAAQRERLARTLVAIDALPPGLRDAMRLRVIEDQPTPEVCRRLAITEDNLFVRLHRARKALAS